MTHQYRIHYQKFLNVMVLADLVVHSDSPKEAFVYDLVRHGHWIDEKTWIAPGCIQDVVVIT